MNCFLCFLPFKVKLKLLHLQSKCSLIDIDLKKGWSEVKHSILTTKKQRNKMNGGVLEQAKVSEKVRIAEPLLKKRMADISSSRFGRADLYYQSPCLNCCCGR